MIRYFAGHPTAANILMLVIILFGLAALPSLNKETFPEIKSDKVQVSIAYPGASPNDVEDGICNRLEDATDGISFLEEQRCESRENMGIMIITMQEAGEIKQFVDDINAAVDRVIDFPDDSEEPVVEELGRIKPVVSVAIRADLTQAELKALAEYYRDQLLALPAVPIVKVTGFSTHQLSVLLKPEALRQYQLSVQDVASKIGLQAIDLPAGVLEGPDLSYQLRFENARRTTEQLSELVIVSNSLGAVVRLGDIAELKNDFVDVEKRSELNGLPAAVLEVSKNTTDDTLRVFDAVKAFVDEENKKLPDSTQLVITQDSASIVKDRLRLIMKNGLQGLILASVALFLFFSWRYTFWVALGLPLSFLGGLVVMSYAGVSINMISMVALLMAIGILMDDAIVLSESIEHQYRKGKTALQAVIDGTHLVARGVFSSFLTSAFLFGSLLFLKGDMGQILGVLPVVLLAVLTVSLFEAFLILPHHLKHSLEHAGKKNNSRWRDWLENHFERLRNQIGRLADLAITYRYIVFAGALGLFLISVSLIASGIVKFKAFPDLEGNTLEARILMSQGTRLDRTEEVVSGLLQSLDVALEQMQDEPQGKLIRNIQVSYSKNADASEEGAHLATISLDLLDAEKRNNSLYTLIDAWREAMPVIEDAVTIQLKEPKFGPAGQAISIRLAAQDLKVLSQASYQLQHWLNGYTGVSNIMDDLRPGKPQFILSLLPGALASGVDGQLIAGQLRAAYQGIKVTDIYADEEAYEINVKLDDSGDFALAEFENLAIFNRQGISIPLLAVASITETRDYSRIVRVNHQRTVTVSGDINSKIANTAEVIGDTKKRFLPILKQRFPQITFSLEGETKNSGETNTSVLMGFILGIAGVYLLLCLQFRNYIEPLVVMINIPLALIGVIWGHYLMGLDLALPSMIGFVSLAGVVVNDSILLVEFIKLHVKEGMDLHHAAGQAVRDRFRAIFLTSVTTIAGMMPLLSETSLQAQVLVPLVASVVFGMLSSTVLIMLVLPATFSILEDLGFVENTD